MGPSPHWKNCMPHTFLVLGLAIPRHLAGQLAWKTRVGPSTRYKSVSWRVQKKVSKAWFPPVRIRRCVNPVLIPSAFLSALPCQPVGPARLSPGVLWRSLLCTNSYSKLWCVVEKFFAIRKMMRVLERKDVGLGAPARTRPSERGIREVKPWRGWSVSKRKQQGKAPSFSTCNLFATE